MRAIARYRRRLLALALPAIPLLVGIVGYWTPRQWQQQIPAEPCAIRLYLSSNRIHTNLLLPVRTEVFDWSAYLPKDAAGTAGDARYLSFGWGDLAFYTQTPTPQDFQLSTALAALLRPTPGVLYVRGYRSLPRTSEATGLTLKPLQLSATQYRQLTRQILATFARAGDREAGFVKLTQTHPYGGNFYAATGSYSALETCNDWTARVLREASVNTPVWSGLASAVLHHARSPCRAPASD